MMIIKSYVTWLLLLELVCGMILMLEVSLGQTCCRSARQVGVVVDEEPVGTLPPAPPPPTELASLAPVAPKINGGARFIKFSDIKWWNCIKLSMSTGLIGIPVVAVAALSCCCIWCKFCRLCKPCTDCAFKLPNEICCCACAACWCCWSCISSDESCNWPSVSMATVSCFCWRCCCLSSAAVNTANCWWGSDADSLGDNKWDELSRTSFASMSCWGDDCKPRVARRYVSNALWLVKQASMEPNLKIPFT